MEIPRERVSQGTGAARTKGTRSKQIAIPLCLGSISQHFESLGRFKNYKWPDEMTQNL